jgi:hypothetical protein
MFRSELPQPFHVGPRVVVNLALLRQAHPIRPDVMRRKNNPLRADGFEVREEFSAPLLDLFLAQSCVVDNSDTMRSGLCASTFSA